MKQFKEINVSFPFPSLSFDRYKIKEESDNQVEGDFPKGKIEKNVIPK